MQSLFWRLRLFLRRALPHTPAKRWAYGSALLLALLGLLLGHVVTALLLAALTVSLRALDLRLSGTRRGRIPTQKAYFFEGQDR